MLKQKLLDSRWMIYSYERMYTNFFQYDLSLSLFLSFKLAVSRSL